MESVEAPKLVVDTDVKDAFIAAICEVHKLPLLTRNVKHFNRIPGLKLLPID